MWMGSILAKGVGGGNGCNGGDWVSVIKETLGGGSPDILEIG